MIFPQTPYTRYRSRKENVATLTRSLYRTDWAGTPSDPWYTTGPYLSNGTTTYSEEEAEIFDNETPQYRKNWLRGIATVNPMEQTRLVWNRGLCNYLAKQVQRSSTLPYYYVGFQEVGTGVIGDNTLSGNVWNYPSSPEVDSSVIAEAITDAWASVDLSDTLVLATAGELSKTLGFLGQTFRRVYKIYRSLRKFDVKALKGEIKPKELAQRYMEARYALRPLAYDVKNNVQAFLEVVPAKYTTFRSYKHNIVETTTPNFLCRQGSNYRVDGTAYATRTLEVRAGVLTVVKAFNSAIRFGVGNIFQSAWELVPFSFIVDWFVNIGQIVASFSPKIGMDTLASWYVVKDTTCLSVTAETGQYTSGLKNYINIYQSNGTYSKVLIQKYRIPNPDRPVLPSFNVKLNPYKLIDLGIIISGLIAKSRPPAAKPSRKTNYGYAWFDN